MRAIRAVWAILAFLMLATGALLAGGRMSTTWDDVHEFSGLDLSNRLGAARTVAEGIDPYTHRNAKYGQPGPPELIRRWNEHPYTPTLIWAYVPLGRLAFADARELDFWLEWAGLALTIGGLTIAFRGVDKWAWAGVALATVTYQFSWRLHVERGQAYVFLAMLAGTGLALISLTSRRDRKHVRHAATPVADPTVADPEAASPASLPKSRSTDLPPRTAASVLASFFRFVGAIILGLAAATRPSLAMLILLLPLCGRGRQAVAAAVAVLAVVIATLFAGHGGYWAGYLRVVQRLELEHITPGTLNSVDDGELYTADPTLADAYAMPMGMRRIKSRAGNLTANAMLWPEVERDKGWPKREQYPAYSKLAAVGWIGLAVLLVGLLWLRGTLPIDRIAVASAMAVTVDFFLPVRYEYADVLYFVPLGLSLAALRARRAVLLPVVIVIGLWWTLEHVTAPGLTVNRAVERVIAMVLLPMSAVVLYALLFGTRWTELARPKVLPLKDEVG